MRTTMRAGAITALATITVVGALASPAFAKTDKQIARASVVQESDLPGTGWSGSKHTEEPNSTLPSCRPTNKASDAGQKYSANSPDFENTDGATVTNTVYVFPSVKQAKAYLAAYKLPTALECLQQGLDERLQGQSGATATVQDLDVTGGPVDDGVGFQGTISGVPTAQTGVTDTAVQAVAFRVGRAVTGFTTSNPGQPFPGTVDIVKAEVARLKKNLK